MTTENKPFTTTELESLEPVQVIHLMQGGILGHDGLNRTVERQDEFPCHQCRQIHSHFKDGWFPDSHWDDHAGHTPEDWKAEVINDDTRQGYKDWVNSQLEAQR